MKVLACYSIKGGVGKTATAVNVAYWASKSNIKTLLIDLDPQGASSFYFRVKPTKKKWGSRFFDAYKELLKHVKASDFENLDVIPAHLSFRNFDSILASLNKRKNRLNKILNGLKKEYDLVILDCPPSISYLSESVFNASNIVLVPVIPTTLSERTFGQLLQFFKDKSLPARKITPFFSMVQSTKNMHRETMDNLHKSHKRFLKSTIPYSADVEKMGEFRAPVDTFARSRPANKAYVYLWKELFPIIKKS